MKKTEYLSLLAIILATLSFYWKVVGFEYVNYDDGSFLYLPAVQNFDLNSLFFSINVNDYIPLTLLSFALEKHIFGGFHPAVSHGLNLCLHIFNIILLYALGAKVWPQRMYLVNIIVFVFALHPMNVESVSWVTERKGLLSFFFLVAALLLYLSDNKVYKNIGSSFFFILSCLSKPVVLILPLLLWLLLFWQKRKNEKLYLVWLVLSIALSAVHIEARNSLTVMNSLSVFDKVLLVPQDLLFYFSQGFWPDKLSVFYSLRNLTENVTGLILSVVFLLVVVSLSVRHKLHQVEPYLIPSLLFFILVLLPQLKIIPYGLGFIYSDRYFYLAGIGLITAVVLLVDSYSGLIFSNLYYKSMVMLLGFIAMFNFVMTTHSQINAWQNSETLWRQALNREPQNALSWNNLGLHFLDDSSRVEDARTAFMNAVKYNPTYSKAYINLAYLSEMKGSLDEALFYLRQAHNANPLDLEVKNMLQNLEFALRK